MMKKCLILAGLLCVIYAFIGCNSVKTPTEVIFIPGWFTEMEDPVYETKLRAIYPNSKITILKWKSDEFNWGKAVSNADEFSPEVVKYISGKPARERKSIVLAGHSLGARIVINTAKELAKNKLKIQQFILLGAAVDYNVDLSALDAAASEKNISIFSRNDSILKYLYGYYHRTPALGFCGLEESPEYLLQYRFTTSEPVISNTDWKTALLETINHMCEIYLDELNLVVHGKQKPFQSEYDYSQVVIEESKIPLPENFVFTPLLKVDILESYGDWALCKITLSYTHTNKEGEKKEYKKSIYFILDHLGRIRKWNLLRFMLESEWSKIKSQIRRKNVSDD